MPKYLQVAEDIIDKIKSNFFTSNQKLPTENKLMEIYSVSRNTIRKALEYIENEGYIFSIQGSGSYVRNMEYIHCLSYKSLSEIYSRDSITTKIINFEIVDPEIKTYQKLQLNFGDKVYKIERLRFVENSESKQLEETYIPVKLIPNLTEKDIKGSIFKYIESNGYSISYSLKKYHSIVLDENKTKLFECIYPTAATVVEANGFLLNDIPFIHSYSYHVNSEFSYVSKR